MTVRAPLVRFFSLLATLSLAATACGGGDGSTATPAPTLPPEASPTPTEAAPRALTICLGQEPASLFPLGNLSSSARAVLAAVYDGPIDSNSYGYQPVILEKLPDLADGDATLASVPVYVGDEVVDAAGVPITLAPGARVRPAGCRSDACAVEYDGTAAIQMDQMTVSFSLLPGLTWSDGTPLTAADSVYAYSLASNPNLPGWKYLVDRTQSYEAADDLTVQWWGKPGYVDPTYFIDFWAPLPRHAWEAFPPEELPEIDAASIVPLGWGPYVVQEWMRGEAIRLARNPAYFRADEGLPAFDTLTFRFQPDPEAAISALAAGECDLLDPGIHLEGQLALLESMAAQGQLQVFTTPTPIMERIDFGIRPAVYDDGYLSTSERADFFGDVRVRQALVLCIDRQAIVEAVLGGLSSVPLAFVPEGHPLYHAAAATYAHDVDAANQLLEQAGWRDTDGDPATPRQAWGVSTVLNGTPLELTYLTTGAAQRVRVASMVADSLAGCGVRVNVEYLDQAALYAPGPEGPLFGRSFDLVQFAMGNTGLEPSCAWFTTPEIPAAANDWVGTNTSGYSNAGFDAACLGVRQALPGEASYLEGYREMQVLFARDLPVIPLYWRLKAAAARPGLLNFSLDPTASSSLWNVESYELPLP
jgi:peptide/nickel transport system substrate-binding protein